MPDAESVFRLFLAGLVVNGFILIGSSCVSKKAPLRPVMVYPGYDTELNFIDEFDDDLSDWVSEGAGTFTVSNDSQMTVSPALQSYGMAIWYRNDVSGDFQIEFEIDFLSAPGMASVIFCAQGTRGEDVIEDLPPRTGILSDYTHEGMRSYSVSFHCYSPDGSHDSGSKIRKNPGHMLLSRAEQDPCIVDRRYLIDILKIGNRILFFVDKVLIQDIRDRGGFGPTYTDGKIGLRFHGAGNAFLTHLDNFKIFKLIPQ